jgi:hypothetical protein
MDKPYRARLRLLALFLPFTAVLYIAISRPRRWIPKAPIS